MQSAVRPRSIWRDAFNTCFRTRFQVCNGHSARTFTAWQKEFDEPSLHTQDSRPGRVHILGIGNVGCFIAHSLAAKRSPPPITLCLHNDMVRRNFAKRKGIISVSTHGLDDTRSGFDIETVDDYGRWVGTPRANFRHPHVQPASVENDPIECLIICTKAHHTELAIQDISHRLTKHTTICFVHNGLGVMEQINQNIFPDPHNRPRYIHSCFNHGLTRSDHFKIAHMGVGSMIISPHETPGTPHDPNGDAWSPSTKYLMRLLTLTPSLVAMAETPADLLQYQLEKIAVNCLLGPLSALSDCTNGELLYSFSHTRVMRLLLFEISAVIRALPELQGVPGIEYRFSVERLRRMAVNNARMTADHSSSMRQDVHNNRRTEIEFFNGYIVRRGEALGIKCALNYMIKHLVTATAVINQEREHAFVPLDLDDTIDVTKNPSI